MLRGMAWPILAYSGNNGQAVLVCGVALPLGGSYYSVVGTGLFSNVTSWTQFKSRIGMILLRIPSSHLPTKGK